MWARRVLLGEFSGTKIAALRAGCLFLRCLFVILSVCRRCCAMKDIIFPVEREQILTHLESNVEGRTIRVVTRGKKPSESLL